MEKKRVEKGEIYWYVTNVCDGVEVIPTREYNTYADKASYESGNYFITKDSAESTAKKLRAVFKGADVIQMPSEEEIEDAMKTSITESIFSGSPYGQFTQRATDLLECAWMKGAEWLKSKTIK